MNLRKIVKLFFVLPLCISLLHCISPSFGQERELPHVPIDTLLKPRWELTLEDWNAYDGKPFVKNGILFPYDAEGFAVDIDTGKKLIIGEEKTQERFRSLFSDSLLLRDNYDQLSIMNIYTGSVTLSLPRKGPAYYGYVSPELIGRDTVFVAKDRNTISAISLPELSTIWDFSCVEKVCTKPKIVDNKVIFCDKNDLYVLDKSSGQLLQQRKLGGRIVSDAEVDEGRLYLWVKGEGLYAINRQTLEIEWNYNDFEYQFGNYRLLFEGDTIFFASWNLFALNKLSGERIWRSDYRDISLVHNVALVEDFIFYYDSGSDGVVSFITAADKGSGECKFYGFTSDSFPVNSSDDPRNLADIEYEELSFLNKVHEEILIGVSRDKVYGFTLKE